MTVEAKAKLRNVRIAPRKARVVADLIRGQNIAVALDRLRFTARGSSPLWSKLLESALANAEQVQPGVDIDRLFIKEIYADMAPNGMMRRWRPRAQGRATRIVKGMSHLTVVLGERTN